MITTKEDLEVATMTVTGSIGEKENLLMRIEVVPEVLMVEIVAVDITGIENIVVAETGGPEVIQDGKENQKKARIVTGTDLTEMMTVTGKCTSWRFCLSNCRHMSFIYKMKLQIRLVY